MRETGAMSVQESVFMAEPLSPTNCSLSNYRCAIDMLTAKCFINFTLGSRSETMLTAVMLSSQYLPGPVFELSMPCLHLTTDP